MRPAGDLGRRLHDLPDAAEARAEAIRAGRRCAALRALLIQRDTTSCLRSRLAARVERRLVPVFGYGAPFVTAEKPPLRIVFCDRRRSVTCAAVTLRDGFTHFALAVPQVRSSLEYRHEPSPVSLHLGDRGSPSEGLISACFGLRSRRLHPS